MTDGLSAAERMRLEAEREMLPPPPSEKRSIYEGADDYRPPPAPRAPTAPYQGGILPFSVNEQGEKEFDPRAGLLGSLVTKPVEFSRDLAEGTIRADTRDPRYAKGVAETAMTFLPGSAAARVAPGMVRAPGQEALRTAGSEAFEAFPKSAQIFDGDAYRAMLRDAANDLAGTQHYRRNAPVPHAAIEQELRRVRHHPFVDAPTVDAFRTAISGPRVAKLKDENLSGTMQVRDKLFGFLEQHGDPTIRDAVGNWRQLKHSELVTKRDAADARGNIADARGPGLTAKQQRDNMNDIITSIEGNKPATRGFRPVETTALNRALNATPSINRAQAIGNNLNFSVPSGAGVLSAASTMVGVPTSVAAVGTGLAAGAAVAGPAARSYANRGARRLAEEADNTIRAQSPLAAEQFATAPPLRTGFGSPGAMPGAAPNFSGKLPIGLLPLERAGQKAAYPVASNPAIAEAVRQRMLAQQPPSPDAPMQYRVLPDGTVEEFM